MAGYYTSAGRWKQLGELLAEYDWNTCAIERERIADELAALGYTVVRHGKCEPVTPIVIGEGELAF